MAKGRKNALWFEFAGVESADMGVRLVDAPVIQVAEERGEQVEIPGRDGALWIPDESFKPIDISVVIEVDRDAEFDEIMQWLCGSGELILSTMEDYYYKARVVKGFDLTPGVYLRGNYQTTIEFSCQPFRYQVGNPIMKPITSIGQFKGRGTWFSRPVITVNGSGDITLIINGVSAVLDDVSEYITLDCDAMMAFKGDTNVSPSVTLLSDGDEWPRLKPAGKINQISWTGNVTSVVIQPNWRWR